MAEWNFDPESTSKTLSVKKLKVLSLFLLGGESLIIILKFYMIKIVLNTLILLLKWKNTLEDRLNMLK